MSKPKFKVGDKVRNRYCGEGIIMGMGRSMGMWAVKLKNPSIASQSGMRVWECDGYTPDGNGRYLIDEELELVVDDNTYTGIELLQAIKDGVFKDGDEFNILHKDKFMDKVRVAKYGGGLTLRYEGGDTHGIVVGIQVITNNHVLFTPIKKEPINIVKANHSTSAEMPIEIMGVTDIIKVNVRYKDNKTTVTLPSGVRGVAKCCTEDKFDMLKGARLAFSRAIKKQLIKDIDKVIEKYM